MEIVNEGGDLLKSRKPSIKLEKMDGCRLACVKFVK
jgi:hypothetical protein